MNAPEWLTDFTTWFWKRVKGPPAPQVVSWRDEQAARLDAMAGLPLGPADQDSVAGTTAVTGQAAPWRLPEGLMREAPPEVMAQFSAEELEADEPLSKAKKAKAVRRSKEPPKKTKPRHQPIKARKVLDRFKAVKTAAMRKRAKP